MTETQLRQAGVSELAWQFACFIDKLNHHADSLVALSAALLSEAVSQGHVCLNIPDYAAAGNAQLPPPHEWIQRLKKSRVVGSEGELTPLVLTQNGQLYLYRQWQDEQWVAQAIKQRCRSIPIHNEAQILNQFAKWQSDIQGVDWQKVAVLMALTQSFCVISGGPGTGKTTIVLRLLQMLQYDIQMRIEFAAPTGKAAARLQEAISLRGETSIEVKTLHRLLKISATQVNGRYDQHNPLPVDVLIVDEASMVDLGLMAKLMRALPESARLILLGDSKQLASVESGAVLANLCQYPSRFTPTFCQLLEKMTALSLPEQYSTDSVSPMTDRLVFLQHSYRFDQTSMIGRLARAVSDKDVDSVEHMLQTASPPVWLQITQISSVENQILAGYQTYFEAIEANDSALACLQAFDKYRVLTALKQGPQSVASVNRLIERYLLKQGWKTQQDFYPGRPIMIKQNDYRQRLYNGDTGIVMYDKQGILKAFFYRDGRQDWIALSHLPAHDTAYAMTIHKSQGSEFDHVCIILPDETSPILSSELLYTALTRSRKNLLLLSSRTILINTIQNQITRESGLAAYLK